MKKPIYYLESTGMKKRVAIHSLLLNKFEDYARDMIAQLGPYLIHTHDRSVIKYMTAES